MSLKIYAATFDAVDPVALAGFYAEALGWKVMFESPEEVAIARDETSFPGVIFCKVDHTKGSKNRLHLDLNPDDQAAEVARLESLGATRVDIGQGDTTWVVMADPEGNELCVLSPHPEQT